MKRVIWLVGAVLLFAATGCGDDDGRSDAAPPGDGATGADAGDDDAGVSPDGGGRDGSVGACPAADLGALLGRDRLFIGGSMSDNAFASAPFDIRYHYVAGDVPETGPCADCSTGCTVNGQSCANSAGCDWWGCWQWDQDPPGRFVADFLAAASGGGAVPMITYYIWFSVAGNVEGAPEIAALDDNVAVTQYLADFRFLCQVMAEPPAPRAILHVEPDLWGYGHQVNDDPEQIPVALSAAGAAECAGLPDTLGGFARCLVAIARAQAPNVLVGLHASAWGAGVDALNSSDPGFDPVTHAQTTAAYLNALGGADTDLVVVEMSDRDAGFNDRWWDPDNQTLPHFTRAIDWVSALGDALALAPLWWQVPYGHAGLEDVCDRYSDNRVDYVFDHPGEFAAAGSLGVAFGAGAGCMTTPDTDDDQFTDRAAQYFTDPRPLLCGP